MPPQAAYGVQPAVQPAGYPPGAGYGPPPAAQPKAPNQAAIPICLIALLCGWVAIFSGLETGNSALVRMSSFDHAIWLSLIVIWNGFKASHRLLAATLCVLLGLGNLLGALTFAAELSAQASRG